MRKQEVADDSQTQEQKQPGSPQHQETKASAELRELLAEAVKGLRAAQAPLQLLAEMQVRLLSLCAAASDCVVLKAETK